MKLLTFKREEALNQLLRGKLYTSTVKSEQYNTYPVTYARTMKVLLGKLKHCGLPYTPFQNTSPIFAWHTILPGQELSPITEQINRALEMGSGTHEIPYILTLDVPDKEVIYGNFYNFADALFFEETDMNEFEFRWTFVFGNHDMEREIQAILAYIKPEWLLDYKKLNN